MRITVLTPGLGDQKRYDTLWRTGLDRLQARFDERGHTLAPHPWSDGPPPEADLVLPLLAWGYHHNPEAWAAAVDAMEAAGTPILNPPSVLRWNADKRYLAPLEMHGAPIVPTRFIDRAETASVAAAAAELDAAEVVVKPQVSGGAYRTLRVRAGESFVDGPEGPAMVQPFLPAVATEGELSMLYFGGAFSHALTKTAVGGDFRVQPQFGGLVSAVEPDAAAFQAAEAALGAVAEALLYARVDMVRDTGGDWRLMELELIEPYLFLDEAPDGGRRFVEAVEAAVANR